MYHDRKSLVFIISMTVKGYYSILGSSYHHSEMEATTQEYITPVRTTLSLTVQVFSIRCSPQNIAFVSTIYKSTNEEYRN